MTSIPEVTPRYYVKDVRVMYSQLPESYRSFTIDRSPCGVLSWEEVCWWPSSFPLACYVGSFCSGLLVVVIQKFSWLHLQQPLTRLGRQGAWDFDLLFKNAQYGAVVNQSLVLFNSVQRLLRYFIWRKGLVRIGCDDGILILWTYDVLKLQSNNWADKCCLLGWSQVWLRIFKPRAWLVVWNILNQKTLLSKDLRNLFGRLSALIKHKATSGNRHGTGMTRRSL